MNRLADALGFDDDGDDDRGAAPVFDLDLSADVTEAVLTGEVIVQVVEAATRNDSRQRQGQAATDKS